MKNKGKQKSRRRHRAGMLMGLLLLVTCVGIIGISCKYKLGKNIRVDAEKQEINAPILATEQSTSEIGDSVEVAEGTSDAYDPIEDMEDYSKAPYDNGKPYYIKVNREQNVVTVYELDENGRYTVPVKAMVCSVGMYNGTPKGTYYTSDKYIWRNLVGNVYGQYAYRINGPIMFHSVPYYRMNKATLETEEFNKLGEAASLGCVRLAVLDAKWIYDNCPTGTIVTIYDSAYPGPLGKPQAEIIDMQSQSASWDPTDPDENNPWNTGETRILGARDITIERMSRYFPEVGVLAMDKYGNTITDSLRIEGNVNLRKSGTYTITYFATDEEGNSAEKTITVTVEDTMAPIIEEYKKTIRLNAIQSSEYNIQQTIADKITILDTGEALGKEALHVDTQPIKDQAYGIFALDCYAVDAAGNQSEVRTINVELDREAPMITVPDTVELSGKDDEAIRQQLLQTATVSDSYGSIDNCKVSWVKIGIGDQYSVLYTATDSFGNVSSQMFDNFIIHYTD